MIKSLIVIIIDDFIQLIIITVTLKIHFNLWLIEHNSIYVCMFFIDPLNRLKLIEWY